MTNLVCPNGHSGTFRIGGSSTTLLAWYPVVDAAGQVVSDNNPNTITTEYTCDVCGATFHVSSKRAAELYRTQGGNVYRSLDNGATWSAVTADGGSAVFIQPPTKGTEDVASDGPIFPAADAKRLLLDARAAMYAAFRAWTDELTPEALAHGRFWRPSAYAITPAYEAWTEAAGKYNQLIDALLDQGSLVLRDGDGSIVTVTGAELAKGIINDAN